MDKWEEMMKKFMAKPEAERMKQIEQSKTMCICTNCPSYRGTGETNLLFCGIGKSSIIKDEKGCSCGLCPVVWGSPAPTTAPEAMNGNNAASET